MKTSLAEQAEFSSLPPLGTFMEDQGGFLGATVPAPEGKMYGLILPPKTLSQHLDLQWKTSYTESKGTDSFIDGWANSEAMNDKKHPAALHCRSLIIGEFNDFYLPSIVEKMALFVTLGPNHTLIPGFRPGEAEAFEPIWHWSSPEAGSDFARRVYFATGGSNWGGKSYRSAVRPVRKFLFKN